MAIGTDRYASGRHAAVCPLRGLSVAALSLPDQWRDPLAQGLRQSVLAPFLFLQRQTELLAAARYRYDAVVAQRDSVALAATLSLSSAARTRACAASWGLTARVGGGYVSAEILHQPEPTNPLSFVVSAGKREGALARNRGVPAQDDAGMLVHRPTGHEPLGADHAESSRTPSRFPRRQHEA